jgi:hypothetical protein
MIVKLIFQLAVVAIIPLGLLWITIKISDKNK